MCPMDHKRQEHKPQDRPTAGRQPSGLTLVELLLAVVVLVVAGLGVLGAYQASFELAEVGEQSMVALNDLKDMTEQIKGTAFGAIQANFPNGVANGNGGNPYPSVVGGYSLTQEQITVAYPNPGTDPLEIIVQISWTNRNRTYNRSISTVRASAT